MTVHNLTVQSTNSPMASLKAQSASTIQTAILSPFDSGAALKRVNAVLANYYEPDGDAETKAMARNEFVMALRSFPDWAVQQAFDTWVRTGVRRPSPAEIAILAERAVRPLGEELARRAKIRMEKLEAEREADREPACKEAAERIMQGCGFTVKRFNDIQKRPMANTWADVDAASDPSAAPAHWSVGKAHDSPEMVALRAARAANPLMAHSMAVAAKNANQGGAAE